MQENVLRQTDWKQNGMHLCVSLSTHRYAGCALWAWVRSLTSLSADYLVAQGIAPRSAMAVPETGGRSKGKRKAGEVEECMDGSVGPIDDEIQVLEVCQVMRFRAFTNPRVQARLTSLREKETKGLDREPRPPKRVKQESQGTLISGEVIDLTVLPLAGRVKREPRSVLVQGEVIDLTL